MLLPVLLLPNLRHLELHPVLLLGLRVQRPQDVRRRPLPPHPPFPVDDCIFSMRRATAPG